MFDKLNSLWLWKFNFKLQNCAEKYFKLQNCAARVLQIFARHLKLVKNAKKFFHSKPAGEENSLQKKKEKKKGRKKKIAFLVQAYFKICIETRSKEMRTIDKRSFSLLYTVVFTRKIFSYLFLLILVVSSGNKRSASPSSLASNDFHCSIDLFNEVGDFVVTVLFTTKIENEFTTSEWMIIAEKSFERVALIEPFGMSLADSINPMS